MLQTSREGGGEETGRLRRQMGGVFTGSFEFIVRDFVVPVMPVE